MPARRSPSTGDGPRSRVLEAAAHLLRQEGAEGLTTRAVAQQAGVQAPTIYRLFGDKAGLIEALADRAMAAYVEETAAAAEHEDGDPVEDLRSAWRRHVAFGLANAELYLLINRSGGSTGSQAVASGIEVLRARVHRIAAAGLLRVEEQHALDLIHAAGTGVVLAQLQAPVDRRDPNLPEVMFDAIAGRIVAAAAPIDDHRTSTIAVTFLTTIPDLPSLTDAERALMAEWVARSLTSLST